MSVYKLSIKNPSQAEGKINGEIIVNKKGPFSTPVATISGLPTPFTTTSTSRFDFDGEIISSGGKSAEEIALVGNFTTEGPETSGDVINSIDVLIITISDIILDVYGVNIGERLIYTIINPNADPTSAETGTQSQADPTAATQSIPATEAIPVISNIDVKSINSKVILSVKSGPGVIIGDTERDIVDGMVEFSGLQFDTPGDYIISITPTSGDIKSTEFSITISPEEDIIPQDNSRGEEEPVTGERPIITQIDETKISLKPMEYDTTTDDNENDSIKSGIGLMPFLWYNGIQIMERDIKSLELYNNGIVPMVNANFIDSSGFIKQDGFPLDDTKFEVFLNSGSDNLKSIHLKFKLQTFLKKKKGTYNIVGTLDIEDFYKIKFKTYRGSSFDVLRKISKKLKIGYNSNITNTNDKMKWKNTGKIYKDFMKEIIQHSYVSDKSFMLGYIDHYWCFNYVDIEKEWNRDISDDIGIDSQGISKLNDKGDSDKIVSLVLSNDPSINNSNLYFTGGQVVNNSTNQSIKKGHFTKIKMYDVNKKEFLEFDVDSQSSTSGDVISLKGNPSDKNYKEQHKTKFLGRFDLDNVHDNYKYAEVQNPVNINNLLRITVDLELPQPNYNLYKYQKVRINFTNPKRTPTSESLYDERISGEWLIIDIRYVWKGNKLLQKIKAARKELSKLNSEKDVGTENIGNENINNSEINENPIVDENPPNSIYVEGETYTLIDKNDIKYKITITKLSSNGKEVVGELKEV